MKKIDLSLKRKNLLTINYKSREPSAMIIYYLN